MGARSSRATLIEPASSPSTTGLSPRARRGRALRVLLVEPDTHYQSLLGAGLSEAGFEVLVVATAEDALVELAPPQPVPHLVIAEVGLEGIDGFTFCDRLRIESRTALVPVFLLARQREPFHPELAGSVGADEYLPKPMEVRDVVALARLKAGRRSSEMAYEAHAARLPLTHVARALLAAGRSGRVSLKEGNGFFALRAGKVVDAVFQGERGVMAFRRLLAFGSGVYAVSYGPELHRGSLLMDLPFLREQVLPALARFDKLREVGVPLAARLTVDFQRLTEHLDTLPEDVISLVRLFDGRRVVRTVLMECRFHEVVAYEAVTRLFALGVLMPACHVEQRESPRELPSFFEPSQGDALMMAREAEAREAEAREAEAREFEARAAEALGEEAPEAEASPAQAAEAEEVELPITVEEEPLSAVDVEVEIPITVAPVILTFPKQSSRRRSQELTMGEMPLASGAEPMVARGVDKV